MADGTPIPEKPRPIGCEECIALLAEVLDGTLGPGEMAAFEAHRATCRACEEAFADAKRGLEWLDFLRAAPEPPADLTDRILARTWTDPLPGAEPALAGAIPVYAGTWYSRSAAVLHRHSAESRLLMTAAMAFFSIAFTLNLVGLRINQLHLRDLAPSALASSFSRSYYSASARVMHYYENLRFVYEVESRMNDLRRAAEPAPAPANGRPESKPSPSARNGAQGDGAAPSGPGGSAGAHRRAAGDGSGVTPQGARRNAGAPAAAPDRGMDEPTPDAEPVPASFPRRAPHSPRGSLTWMSRGPAFVRKQERAERSLT